MRRSQGNYLLKWITRTSFKSPTIAPAGGVSLVVSSRTNDDDASDDNVVSGANVACGANTASGTDVAASSNVASGAT